MTKAQITTLFFGMVLLSSAPEVLSAEAEVEAANSSEEEKVEEIEKIEEVVRSDIREIIVNPTLTRQRLRQLEVEVENSFFERFNELNLEDEYDILCYRIKPIGSHISKRVCEPNFVYAARSENASEVMFLLGNPSAIPPPLKSEQELVINAQKQYEELLKRMEEMTQTDVEFNRIGSALGEIRYQLENYGKDD